ncbi:MAG TPA: fatty acid desaturase [Planctomycetota bacterium]
MNKTTERPAHVESVLRFGAEHSAHELIEAVPSECFERSVPRQLLGLSANLAAIAVVWWGLAVAPWWLLPPLWFLAGTVAWGLMVIAHECGHGSFSKNRRLNHVFGHLLMTPFLYPFHSWRLLHHHHHTNTNSLEKDIDWRPLPPAIYRRLSARKRFTYRMIRTWFWWAGTLHQLVTQAFDRDHPYVRKDRERAYMRFSMGVVIAYAAVFFPLMWWGVGPLGLVKFWLVPWVVAYGWFSVTTLMHHTHPEVPFLDKADWNATASNLCMTVYCRYPRWMEFFGHDINVHVPHHVAPHVPYFRLRRAHAALAARFPEQVREIRFSWRGLWQRMRDLHLYDRHRDGYRSFAAGAGAGAGAGAEAGAGAQVPPAD